MSIAEDFKWTLEATEMAEAARCSAMIAGDGAVLRDIFAEDSTWIHSSGQLDAREAFIGKIESGASQYLTIERSEITVRIYESVAIVSGIATMNVLAGGEPRSLRNRFTNMWAVRAGRPVLVSAQSTKIG
ncbi:nuclear transport factor 2 family protein [Govanella unica]|uniref:Nuclear transport factor 2 family protein n=1 Tax=Govanella unica TaxID=2975056 RepID=A0A9X3TZ76_9PROT|nr:nuclear transport factor 2 family protein [Govania unica]MDA5194440.1 nuclear transport factor 2 family protein [Govania unica]